MSLYRTIFKQSWQITRQTKYLWFFGLFTLMAFLGNEGEMNLLFRMFSFQPSDAAFPGWQSFWHSGLFSKQGIINSGHLLSKDPFQVVSIVFTWLLIIALAIFIVWLVNICLAGLVNNSALIISKKKASFEEGIQVGMRKFWPVFTFNLLLKIIAFLLFTPFVIIALAPETITLNLIYVLLFVVFVPLIMSVSFVIRYAIAYSVIKNKKFGRALGSGWDLFVRNWLVSLEFAILLFFINAAVLFAIFIFVLFMFTPVYFMLLVAQKLFSLAGFWLMVVGIFIISLILLALVGAIFAVFQTTAWINLFVILESRGGTSKVLRFFGRRG